MWFGDTEAFVILWIILKVQCIMHFHMTLMTTTEWVCVSGQIITVAPKIIARLSLHLFLFPCILRSKGYLWWGMSWPGWVSRGDNGSYPPEEPGPGKLYSAGSVEVFDASEGHWWGRWLTKLSDRSLQLHRVWNKQADTNIMTST